jgi:hypothetical protein
LQLHGRAGVLLVPDRDQRGLEPSAHGAEPVDPGMASGAKGNQESALMDPGTAMMDGELTLRPAPLTPSAVAVENRLAAAGKAPAGMRLFRIAMPAQAGAKQLEAAAGAEKPGLPALPARMAGRERGRVQGRTCLGESPQGA